MTEQLKTLLNCGRPWAAHRAQTALDVKTAFDNGEISKSEYKELLQDLVRTDKLDAEADDMETKAMLVTGIYALLQLV